MKDHNATKTQGLTGGGGGGVKEKEKRLGE